MEWYPRRTACEVQTKHGLYKVRVSLHKINFGGFDGSDKKAKDRLTVEVRRNDNYLTQPPIKNHEVPYLASGKVKNELLARGKKTALDRIKESMKKLDEQKAAATK